MVGTINDACRQGALVTLRRLFFGEPWTLV